MKPLLDDSVTKITVLDLDTGEEIAVITNELVTTANDRIVVKVTPYYV